MECERCHAENYDEAYYCKKCGVKLNKPKNSNNTTQRSNVPYDYQQQPNNKNNQQQYDNYGSQNNYQQQYNSYGSQSNYQQQYNSYDSQNDYQQSYNNYGSQSNYQQPHEQNSHSSYGNSQNSNTAFSEPNAYTVAQGISDALYKYGIVDKYKDENIEQDIQRMLEMSKSYVDSNNDNPNNLPPDALEKLKQGKPYVSRDGKLKIYIPSNGKFPKEHFTQNSNFGNKEFSKDETIYSSVQKISSDPLENIINDIGEKAKKAIKNSKKNTEPYSSSYNSSYNSSRNSSYDSYNHSYNRSYDSYDNMSKDTKKVINVKKTAFIFLMILVLIILAIVGNIYIFSHPIKSTLKNFTGDTPTSQSSTEPEYIEYSISSPVAPYTTVNFSAPEEYSFSSLTKSDKASVYLRKHDEDNALLSDIDINICKGDVEKDISEMLKYNYKIISEESIQTKAGKARFLTTSITEQINYKAYIDLGNNQFLYMDGYNLPASDTTDQELKEILIEIIKSCTVVSDTEKVPESKTE